MNICEQTKIRMLEGASLSAEEQKHLETCPDCRSLAAFAGRMEQLPAMEKEVPAYLDAAILQAAGVPVSKPRWKMIVLKVAVPAAAVFAFAAGLLLYQPKEVPADSKPVRMQQAAAKKSTSGKQVAAVKATEKRPLVKREDSTGFSYSENFDEQVFTFALDLGNGMSTFSETLDSVSETMDFMI